jgi:hypothetical protein
VSIKYAARPSPRQVNKLYSSAMILGRRFAARQGCLPTPVGLRKFA